MNMMGAISVGLIALCPAARCQVPSPISAVVAQTPTGTCQLTLQNHAGISVTAYSYSTTFELNNRKVTGEFFRDSQVLLAEKPIPPNGQVTSTFGQPAMTSLQCQFRAAVFSDGTGFGDSVWTQRILHRRVYTAHALDALLWDLTEIIAGGGSAISALGRIQMSRDNQLKSAADQDQTIIIRRYYDLARTRISGIQQDPSGALLANALGKLASGVRLMRSKIK